MTLAARKLGRAQSAVSMAIGLLEADLGLELFHRTGRNVRLTQEGEIMLLEARALLLQAQALDTRARSLLQQPYAKLCIAMDEALPYQPIPLLLKELGDRHPALELTVLYGAADEVERQVAEGRAQLAFQFDWHRGSDQFSQRSVASVPAMICVSRDHPLAREPVVTRQMLSSQRQVVLSIEGTPDLIYSPKVWRSNSFYVLADMVAAGLGWAILPQNIAEFAVVRSQIIALRCQDLEFPSLDVRMLTLPGTELDATSQWIQKRMSELLTVAPQH